MILELSMVSALGTLMQVAGVRLPPASETPPLRLRASTLTSRVRCREDFAVLVVALHAAHGGSAFLVRGHFWKSSRGAGDYPELSLNWGCTRPVVLTYRMATILTSRIPRYCASFST